VAEAKVVVSAEPFHNTASPETKLVPVTVRVNPEPPAVVLVGESEFKMGVGGGKGVATVKVTVTVPGEPCAAASARVTCPVYVPAANPLTVAETVKFWGAVPPLGETLSQAESVESVKFKVLPPALVTAT